MDLETLKSWISEQTADTENTRDYMIDHDDDRRMPGVYRRILTDLDAIRTISKIVSARVDEE